MSLCVCVCVRVRVSVLDGSREILAVGLDEPVPFWTSCSRNTIRSSLLCFFFFVVALRESQHPEEAAVTLLFLNKNQCFQFLRLRPAGLEDSRCGSNTRPEDQQVCEGPGQRPGPGRSLEHEARRWGMKHLQSSFLEVTACGHHH